MSTRPTRVFGVIVCLALLLGGCRGEEPEAVAAPTERPSPSPRPAPSRSPIPAPTASPRPDPSPPSSSEARSPVPAVNDATMASEEELRAIYDDLVDRAGRLGEDPPNADLESVYTADCNCFATYRDYVADLVEQGVRVAPGENPEVLNWEILSQLPNAFEVEVEFVLGGGELINADGSIIEAFPRSESGISRVTLTRGEDGIWRQSRLIELQVPLQS